MKTHIPLISLLALLLAASGCADGDGSSTASVTGSDECLGAADQSIVSGLDLDGGTQAEAVNDIVSDCLNGPASPCYTFLFDPEADVELSACLSNCTAPTPVAGLSEGCLNCYAESTRCVGDHCLLECVGGDPVTCLDCIELHCLDELAICTGMD